jgi:MFS family permease
MAVYISIIHIPWSLKILYGLISDNVPLFGTRRKSYLILMGCIQFLALFALYSFQFDDPLVVAIMMAFASGSEAFVNVVSDAIMVIQSRKDKDFGSQDFVTLMYLSTGTGGIFGCIAGGLITEYWHPKWVFFWYSFFGLILAFTATKLTMESERDKVVDTDATSEIT